MLDYIIHGDVVEIKKAIDVLNKSEDVNELKDALEILEFHTQSIDHANNLDKLSGLDPVLRMLEHNDDGVKLMAAWVLGTCSQNNPEFQQLLYDRGGIEKLSNIFISSDNNELLRKIIYAISGSLRNQESSIQSFTNLKGFERCVDILKNSKDEHLKAKVAFMLRSLGRDFSIVRDIVKKENLYDTIIKLLELEKGTKLFE